MISELYKKLTNFKSLGSERLRIKVFDNTLNLYMVTDDGTIELSDSMDYISDTDIECCVEFKEFYKIINTFKTLKCSSLSLREEHYNLIVSSEDTNLELTIDSTPMPIVDIGNLISSAEVKNEELSTVLKKTVKFTDANSYRVFLRGLYVNMTSHNIEFCGANGHVVCRDNIETDCSAEKSVIVPKKACECLMTVLKNAQECVKIAIYDKALSVVCGNITFNASLIPDDYPNINALIFEPTFSFTVSKSELEKKLKILSVKGNYVEYNVTDKLYLKTKNAKNEVANANLKLLSNSEGEYHTALNSEFVLDFIKDLNDETITIDCHKRMNNVIIKENKTTYVLARVVI